MVTDFLKKLDASPDQLNTLMNKLQMSKFSKEELLFAQEYVKILGPIATALDLIQGDNVSLGHVLPMIVNTKKALASQAKDLKICEPLLKSALDGVKKRFDVLFEDRTHLLASLSHPEFKTRWIMNQDEKEKAVKLLKAEVSSMIPNVPDESSEKKEQTLKTTSLFYFEDEETTQEEDEVQSFLKCQKRELLSLKAFPTIGRIFRKYNTILPSSASCERLFSRGKLTFGDKRHRLLDSSAEKQVMLNHNARFYK